MRIKEGPRVVPRRVVAPKAKPEPAQVTREQSSSPRRTNRSNNTNNNIRGGESPSSEVREQRQRQLSERVARQELPPNLNSNIAGNLAQRRLNLQLDKELQARNQPPSNDTPAATTLPPDAPTIANAQAAQATQNTNPTNEPAIREGEGIENITLEPPLAPKAVQRTIELLANERGESSGVTIRAEGSGRVAGAVTLGGSLELGVNVSKTDEGKTAISLDAEAAITAGIDFGPFGKIEGTVGIDSTIEVEFQNSEDAAKWLSHQVNTITGQETEGTQQENVPQPASVIVRNGVSAKIGAEISIPDYATAGADIEIKRSTVTRTNPDGTVESMDQETTTVSGKIETRNYGEAEYQFTETTETEESTGEVTTTQNHRLSFTIPANELKNMSTEGLQRVAEELTERLPNGSGIQSGDIANQIQNYIKNSGELNGDVRLTFESNNIQEDGRFRNQYRRLYLDAERSYSMEGNIGIIDAKVETTVTKSELLAEWTSGQTESYSQGIYGNGNRSEWNAYKQENRDTLEQIIQNRVAQNPEGPIARAYGENENFDAALTALEANWSQQNNAIEQSRQEVRREQYPALIANAAKGGILTPEHQQTIVNIFREYEDNPQQLRDILEQARSLPFGGFTPNGLLTARDPYHQDTTNLEQIRDMLNRAYPEGVH